MDICSYFLQFVVTNAKLERKEIDTTVEIVVWHIQQSPFWITFSVFVTIIEWPKGSYFASIVSLNQSHLVSWSKQISLRTCYFWERKVLCKSDVFVLQKTCGPDCLAAWNKIKLFTSVPTEVKSRKATYWQSCENVNILY